MDRPDEDAVDEGPHDPGAAKTPAAAHPTATPFRTRLRRRSSRWLLVGAVVAVVSVLTSLFAFGLGRDPSVINSPLIGRPAPDFALRTLDGARLVRLSSLRGQVVVINFWASWCAACREEHPALIATWQRYRDQGVILLGIDFQDRKSDAVGFMKEMGADWPILEDPGGRAALAFGVYGVPETYFVGPDGIVRYKKIGASSYELLTDQIEQLLHGGR